MQANKKSYEGLQAAVKRQTELLKEAIGEWRTLAKVMSVVGARESIAKLDEIAKGAFEMALENIRELAELAAESQAEAFEVVRRRIRQDVNDVSKLLNRG